MGNADRIIQLAGQLAERWQRQAAKQPSTINRQDAGRFVPGQLIDKTQSQLLTKLLRRKFPQHEFSQHGAEELTAEDVAFLDKLIESGD